MLENIAKRKLTENRRANHHIHSHQIMDMFQKHIACFTGAFMPCTHPTNLLLPFHPANVNGVEHDLVMIISYLLTLILMIMLSF
uniref:Uncharacterized protein n=1 Tax=Aegilops tauschii subsp. strangulata TaxID=200361 RepID=A0A453RBA3_AEGTS